MAYHLLNIDTSEYYYCDDSEWINAIETAKEKGWRPDGTVFDTAYDAADQSFDSDDPVDYFFMLISSGNEALEWDGNYIEKKNQVVMYEDTIYLALELEDISISPGLLEFVKKGSFRICSD